jgi:hypothetical protein
MNEKETMKLALEALETLMLERGSIYEQAITALKERLAQDKALQTLHNENERLGLYRDAYAEQEPVAHDPLPRACNLAGLDYQIYLKIKAYMPVYATTPPQRTEPLIGCVNHDCDKCKERNT